MKMLNTKSLRKADIILTTTTHAVSKAIRLGTRSDISHAMLYVDEYSAIDATSEGVQGLGNRLIVPNLNSPTAGTVPRRERLGGRLNYSYRAAA